MRTELQDIEILKDVPYQVKVYEYDEQHRMEVRSYRIWHYYQIS